MSNNIELFELLMTKVSHDLANLIGAINNGIEFLEEENSIELQQKAFKIIADNAIEASNKLKFFRYLYGVTQSDGETDSQELKDLINGFFVNSKYKLKWINEHKGDHFIQLTNRASKLTANLIYIASQALLHGGEMTIEIEGLNHGKRVRIIASGDKIKFDDELKAVFGNKSSGLTLSNAHMHFSSEIAKQIGVIPTFTYENNSLEIIINLT